MDNKTLDSKNFEVILFESWKTTIYLMREWRSGRVVICKRHNVDKKSTEQQPDENNEENTPETPTAMATQKPKFKPWDSQGAHMEFDVCMELKNRMQQTTLPSRRYVAEFISTFPFPDNGEYGLVFEFIDGINLEDLLDRTSFKLSPCNGEESLSALVSRYRAGNRSGQQVNPMALGTLASIFGQAACGLEFIHLHNIAHRDIKEANFMVGADGCVKLIDLGYGFSRNCSPSSDLKRRLGTLTHASPEIYIRRHYRQAYSFEMLLSADCWAFAVMIYRFLHCARWPFGNNAVNYGGNGAERRLCSAVITERPDFKSYSYYSHFLPFHRDIYKILYQVQIRCFEKNFELRADSQEICSLLKETKLLTAIPW